ncbi:MAG: hypothetical protein JJU20_05605 [Opitutales bacterium]|nr:hypothetical protein [Opitutales bacterium]
MLRLKEKPTEWIKFTAVMGITVNLLLAILCWQGLVSGWLPVAAIALAILSVIAASLRPHWFRGFYRAGMTLSFHIGQTFGKLLLILIFFLMVTPMGLLLRLLGKDLLQLKPAPEKSSYWQPAKNNRNFDRMF